VSDELIPGTLNVGHALPTIAQALIYTTIIEVDMLTLITMIIASVAGRGWARGWCRAGRAGGFASGWGSPFSPQQH
jgi:hypothetical protein